MQAEMDSKERRRNIIYAIPKFDLESRHIANARLVSNRKELLQLFPKRATAAELGVDEGEFSKLILENCNPQELVLVDFWGTKRYNQEKRKKVEMEMARHINSGRVKIDIGYSYDVAGNYPDKYFDWIYIDTDHSYATTKKELKAWSAKVKPGGIIAGHDYVMGNWVSMFKYGVIEAVHEFCVNEDWEIIFLTMELSTNRSFAIRKRN